ncbi:MAG: hypothetical protein RLZZ353_941 [Actinomycetota bacterium]
MSDPGTPRVTDGTAVPDDAAVLDRIEDGVAVLLVGPAEAEVTVPAAVLPTGAREGDWFRLGLTPDPALTEARRADLAARLDEVRRTRRGGRFGA